MVELPEGREWDMLVFDVDGTILDAEGMIPETITPVSYTHLTLPTTPYV